MKKIILTAAISMMLGSTVTALAATNETVQATFAQFNLLINGQTKQLETTPLVYNGTSYLPVRDMANLFGYDVTYKADSRTIELSNVTNSTYAAQPLPPTSASDPILDVPIKNEGAVKIVPVTSEMSLTDWIDMQSLQKDYNVQVYSGSALKIVKGSQIIEFPYPENIASSTDQIFLINTAKGEFSLRSQSGTIYLKKIELSAMGIMPQ